ncbi:glycosyl transferase, partial [Pediococcus acidilactici]
IENKKTGLGKALNDIILYSKNELGEQKIEQIDITHNTKFLEHIFRILTSTSDVYYFSPSGSKLGVWRNSFYLLAMNLRKKRVIC